MDPITIFQCAVCGTFGAMVGGSLGLAVLTLVLKLFGIELIVGEASFNPKPPRAK